MKNNIIIAGVLRAGKSTVSHLLSKKYGYQHVSMDSIIAGFEKCFPETGVNTYQGLKTGAAQRCRKWGEGSFGEIVQREPKTRLKSAATME